VNITDAPHYFEIDWAASSAPGANNGILKLWIDDALKQALTTIDNDTRQLDSLRLGAVSEVDTELGGRLPCQSPGRCGVACQLDQRHTRTRRRKGLHQPHTLLGASPSGTGLQPDQTLPNLSPETRLLPARPAIRGENPREPNPIIGEPALSLYLFFRGGNATSNRIHNAQPDDRSRRRNDATRKNEARQAERVHNPPFIHRCGTSCETDEGETRECEQGRANPYQKRPHQPLPSGERRNPRPHIL
jgi:hypothetical protein